MLLFSIFDFYLNLSITITLLGLGGLAVAKARLAIKDVGGRVAAKCCKRRGPAPLLLDDQVRVVTPTLEAGSLSC